jgi:hypothetical protein
MKTNGQILYEHKAPSHIRVVSASNKAFATSDDVFLVPNPVHHTPWRLLTKACQESWEKSAVGHNLFSKEATC